MPIDRQRVFLTGASGFVGYHVARVFKDAGWDVECLVRESSDTTALEELGVELFSGWLDNPATYQNRIEGVDLVVHCAGAIKALNLAGFMEVNAEAAGAVAVAATNAGVPRIVLISSIAARGPVLSEGQTDFSPVSNYGQSKLEGEIKVRIQSDLKEVSVLRPPPVYGPRDHGMLDVFKMADKGWFPTLGDGSCRFGIIHGEDLARAVLALAVVSGPLPPGPFYPEDGSRCSMNELADAFSEALGRRLRRPCLPAWFFWTAGALASGWSQLSRRPSVFSLDKVHEMTAPSWESHNDDLIAATGWTPQIPLVDGIKATYAWYRKHGWL